ncbi:MAG: alpha/beta fold hydrolase [Planctomycetaceae bacterium]|nr:alpha/beta fold hydrolase [Planctomycetaceae bacterium]
MATEWDCFETDLGAKAWMPSVRFRWMAGSTRFTGLLVRLICLIFIEGLCVESLLTRAHADEPASSATDDSVPDSKAESSTTQASPSPVIEVLGKEASTAQHAFYETDRSIPLEARTVERIAQDETIREKVVFRGVQGFLVPGYLQYATDVLKPRPCVLLLHGWSGSKEHFWKDGGYISGGNIRTALLAAGYAVMALDAQCHGDRIAENDFAPVNHFVDPEIEGIQRKGYFTQQEIYIQTTRDYRRAIDYLETRVEIDANKIGVFGYSMGGAQTFLLTGVEPRVKVSVACATPADNSKFSSIAPQNFAAEIGQRPFLMLMGRTDTMCPVEKAQALLDLIPAAHKQLMFYEAGHRLPVDYVPQAVKWITTHLP